MAQKILFETALTDTEDTDVEGVGTERIDSKGRRYRWVKNASAPTARVGAPACYDMGNGAAADFVDEVLSDLADEDIALFAGIFLSAIPNGEYGWIQTWGRYATARYAEGTTTTAAAVGDQLIPHTSTDTTVTADGKAMAFVLGADISLSVGTGAATAQTVGNLIGPHVVALEACAVNTDTASTTPATHDVFIKGLM